MFIWFTWTPLTTAEPFDEPALVSTGVRAILLEQPTLLIRDRQIRGVGGFTNVTVNANCLVSSHNSSHAFNCFRRTLHFISISTVAPIHNPPQISDSSFHE